jgi:polyhydroxybutyrate depolymerase
MLKRLLVGLLTLLLLGAAAAGWFLYAPDPPRPEDPAESLALQLDGNPRTYTVSSPDPPQPGASILFVLHPSRGSGARMRLLLGWTLERITRNHNTLLVYPDGYEGHFNDCRRAGDYSARKLDIDDVAFMRAIVAQLVAQRRADPHKVYALGYSNGGHFALRLALQAPDLVQGVIAVAAGVPTVENLDCPLAELPARAIVLVEGQDDPINPYNGGPVTLFGFGNRGNVRPARAGAGWLAQTLGLAPTPSELLADAGGMAAYRDDWRGADGRVRLVTIQSGGHTVPQEAYRYPRLLGRTFRSDAVLESSWRFVRGDQETSPRPGSAAP